MSKVTDSDTKSDSSDTESLLSCNNPSKLVPHSFEPLASLKDEDSNSEGMLSSNHSTVVEQRILNGVNAIIVDR